MGNLLEELTTLLNSFSRENESNTPDFILANFMLSCLVAFEKASNQRENWYGWENVLGVSHPIKLPDLTDESCNVNGEGMK
jgi:hypothetical protein